MNWTILSCYKILPVTLSQLLTPKRCAETHRELEKKNASVIQLDIRLLRRHCHYLLHFHHLHPIGHMSIQPYQIRFCQSTASRIKIHTLNKFYLHKNNTELLKSTFIVPLFLSCIHWTLCIILTSCTLILQGLVCFHGK